MCQHSNKIVPRGKDIIAYKVFYVDFNEFLTVYQKFPMEIGKTYSTNRYHEVKDCSTKAIENGFFHSYKNLADAERWIKLNRKWRKRYYMGERDYRIMKVRISNINSTDIVYEGLFQSACDSLDSPTYASNQIEILEEVK